MAVIKNDARLDCLVKIKGVIVGSFCRLLRKNATNNTLCFTSEILINGLPSCFSLLTELSLGCAFIGSETKKIQTFFFSVFY